MFVLVLYLKDIYIDLSYSTEITYFRDFDFFRHQKEEGFRDSIPSMELLGSWLLQELPATGSELINGNGTYSDDNGTKAAELFSLLLQISLWGNK